MVAKKEEFVLDVRRAARLAEKPTIITSSGLANPDVIAKTLQRESHWLTPKVVEHYDPAQFGDLTPELRDSLTHAVETFRASAATVPADQFTTAEQFARAERAFRTLVMALREVVLAEWKRAVDVLVGNTEAWAKDLGWVTKYVQKRLSETLLGTYEIPQLLMYAPPHLYVLDPVARFVPGAAGAFELSVQPSFYTISVYRDFGGMWYAHHDVGQAVNNGKRNMWSKDTLQRCVEELRGAAMIKRQQRLQRIANVAQEFLAAKTAADWLKGCQEADPSFGNQHGWEAKAGIDFCENMETTYIVRMYAEFEAGLRDYWKTHLKRDTHPKMMQLVRHAIPNQMFSQDAVDDADEVRVYRNYLVHDLEDEVPEGVRTFTVVEAKRCLCAYFGRLDASWQ